MVRRDAGLAARRPEVRERGARRTRPTSPRRSCSGITELGSTLVVVWSRRSSACSSSCAGVRCARCSCSCARRRRAERDRQRREGTRRPGPARHRSARRVLGPVVPERPLRGGRRDLCRVRAARCSVAASRRASQALARGRRGIAIAGAVASSRVLLGVHWFTDVLAGPRVGLGLVRAWCAIAFGGRLLRFGAPVEVAERAERFPLPVRSATRN